MANDYNKGVHQKVIREKLNAEKVKLWLPPYTTEGGEKGDNPEELIQRYSSELNLSYAVVMETIESLRQHALQKLAEKKKYQESGLALLKVKVSGVPSTPDGTQITTKKTRVEAVEIPLSASGKDLYHSVSARISLPPEQLKMICEGHIINMTLTLFEQNVKHGAQIMCLCLSASEAEVARKQEEFAQMMSTRHAAELLSRKVEKGDDDDFEIQIADQSGRPLQLPPEEKKALTLAMTLHEKGRVALKRKEIAKSLLLLLEADKEFRKCRADILQAVDNYAVLCLDIVWCYLCLKNVEDLPDADQRLRASEECFKRSYGDNMERVRAVKGGSGTELALFMKLHLLKGIVAFHKHETENAHRLLALAKEELGHLQVDEDKLTEVMALGYTEREARLGLRASAGNIPQAVQHIIQKKEEKEQISKKVKEERRKKRTQKMLGKTSNGQMVNVDNYEMLTGMGFCKGAAAEALRQANNDINMALEVLQLHPDLLNLPDPTPQNLQITDDMIAQVVAMGFNLEMARLALKQQSGNIQHAIDELIKKGGIIIPSPNGGSSSSTSDSSPEQEDAASRAETKQQKEKEKEVLRDLVSDLPEDEEDYLDLKLNEEAEFLQEYITLLESVSHK